MTGQSDSTTKTKDILKEMFTKKTTVDDKKSLEH